MNRYNGVSILLQTAASASTLMPLSKINELVTYDDNEEILQLHHRRDARRRQARERIASLKQIDVNRLPLVATDRSVIERALREPEISAIQQKSPARSNGGSKHTIDRDHTPKRIAAVSGIRC